MSAKFWTTRSLCFTQAKQQPSFHDSYKCNHVRMFTLFLADELESLYDGIAVDAMSE